MSTRGIMLGIALTSVAVTGVIGTATSSSAAPTPPTTARESVSAVVPIGTSTHAQAASYRAARSNRSAAPARSAQVAPAAAVPSRVQLQQRFVNFTLHSRQTRDLRGVEGSLYRGRYFRASVEPLRKCIQTRESEGHYDVVSPSGLYFGAYQVSRPLARGATWMMLREHKQLMGETSAKKVLTHLRSIPMNRWPRYWQDAAFHTIMNWEHARSGAGHWAGGRWHC